MYALLFHAVAKAICTLQEAQQQAEDMYVADDETDRVILLLPGSDTDACT